jgi:DNA replication protein DnaC
MSVAYEQQASTALQQLGLAIAEKQVDQAAQQAAAASWSYTHFLGYLLEAELRFRREKTVRLSLMFANLPYQKRLDEVGYLTLETTHASLLFQVICERYEKQQAILLTNNKAFADWSHVFAGDAIMASAALDRLIHRSTVINIRDDSYRLKEKRKNKAAMEVIAE